MQIPRPTADRWKTICGLMFMAVMACGIMRGAGVLSRTDAEEPAKPGFDGDRAYKYLVELCRLGPRMSGSAGMAAQQKLIVDHFTALKAQVRFQSFDATHPLNGGPVRMSNIIVSWHPESTERVLLACHYDTRPFPDRDRKRGGQFIGANDGASGVALLMELGNQMPGLAASRGVDFVLFDGEEFVMEERGAYFLGSERFARDYVDHPPKHRYVAAVLFDMIADRNLNIYKEKYSVKYAPALTSSIWNTAKKLNVDAFHNFVRHEIRDDHLALNEIAKIPTCDIIDFDYGRFNGYWHTSDDAPAMCSGESLAQVGRVMLEWLKEPPPAERD